MLKLNKWIPLGPRQLPLKLLSIWFICVHWIMVFIFLNGFLSSFLPKYAELAERKNIDVAEIERNMHILFFLAVWAYLMA